jgi:predicted unusual protein kinase regulating ubiquinone biosynthesis (AarF/ABC1/UbiB family)
MTDESSKGRAIPRGRLSRLGQFGRLASGVAGGMLAEGARRLADGERPKMRDMLLTPGNAMRLADRLSHLRGAAMKLGQMISMDSGEMLPPELAQILARLRDGAHHMPPQQLQRVLAAEWGQDWRKRFARFDASPLAAASIGQVHRAITHDGRDLAVKIQYPGVRDSIDSDVDNVATLLRVSGLLPREFDVAALLAEAKLQLHEETDYAREGAQMEAYRRLLADRPEFVVPALDTEFTTQNALAMSFIAGRPIETVAEAGQDERDRVMALMIDLVLEELFDFGVMQTDPNFANYRYQPESGRIVLLDFGAARQVTPATADAYRALLVSGLAGDRDAVRAAALSAGFMGNAVVERHRASIDRIIDVIITEMGRPGPLDFADRSFIGVIRDEAAAIAADRATWHIPPTDTLFVQRKISGTALLAARLRARVDIRAKVVARIEGRS